MFAQPYIQYCLPGPTYSIAYPILHTWLLTRPYIQYFLPGPKDKKFVQVRRLCVRLNVQKSVTRKILSFSFPHFNLHPTSLFFGHHTHAPPPPVHSHSKAHKRTITHLIISTSVQGCSGQSLFHTHSPLHTIVRLHKNTLFSFFLPLSICKYVDVYIPIAHFLCVFFSHSFSHTNITGIQCMLSRFRLSLFFSLAQGHYMHKYCTSRLLVYFKSLILVYLFSTPTHSHNRLYICTRIHTILNFAWWLSFNSGPYIHP